MKLLFFFLSLIWSSSADLQSIHIMLTLHCVWEWYICTRVNAEGIGLGWFWRWIFKARSVQSRKLWENVVTTSWIFISISFLRWELVLQFSILISFIFFIFVSFHNSWSSLCIAEYLIQLLYLFQPSLYYSNISRSYPTRISCLKTQLNSWEE